MNTIDTFCPECWKPVCAQVQEKAEKLFVKGIEVETVSQVAVCPLCGAAIGDSRLEDGNLQRAYDEYRKREGVISPQQIKGLREKYGISQKSLGLLLGIGVASIVRYEDGSLPSASNNELLMNALNTSYFRDAFERKGPLLPKAQQENVKAALDRGDQAGFDYFVLRLDATTGYRAFDEDRLVQCLFLLSKKIKQNYVTAMLKGLFLADFMCFEKTGESITGLQYAALPMGPVPDGYKNILRMLASKDRITIKDTDFGQKIEAQDTAIEFDQDVSDIVDLAARYINSFQNTNELSEETHSLMIWRECKTGHIMEYQDSEEVYDLVTARVGG